MDRATITRRLPAGLKKVLRPIVVPVAYRIEQRRIAALYESLVGRGDLVFDIGAAEGYHTEVLRRLGCRVVCVEPQPRFVAVLERRFAGDLDVTIEACGAGAEIGELELAVSVGDPELSTFAVDKWSTGPYAGRSWEQRALVPITTIDALIERHGLPVFVKIDVEGYEVEVLRGMSQAPPVLSFEFNAALLDDVEACLTRLREVGARSFNFSRGRRHQLVADDWLPADRLIERVRSTAGKHSGGGDVFARP